MLNQHARQASATQGRKKVKNLAEALQPNLGRLQAVQTTGRTGPLESTDGLKAELMRRLQSFSATGRPSPALEVESSTGTPPGRTVVGTLPPEVPASLAEESLMRLPSSVRSWLNESELMLSRMVSVGYQTVPKPTLTETERETCRFEVAMVKLITQPAYTRPQELTHEVGKFLAVWPFGLRHDPALMAAKVNEWCSDLEHFPMYAVKRALNWWRRNSEREPSISQVLEDCRLFTGDKVLKSLKMMESLV